jgi:hypothetical protein
MAKIDKRFALIRSNEERWYAAIITARGSAEGTYRLSKRGETRDVKDQAERVRDIEAVVKGVLQEKKRMRCAPEKGVASSLDLESDDVEGYVLDPILASKLGFPTMGKI